MPNKNLSSRVLVVLALLVSACTTTNVPGNTPVTTNSMTKSVQKNSFKIKASGAGKTENTDTTNIKYSGNWSVVNDGAASAGSVSSTPGNGTDNGNPNLVSNPFWYLGNNWSQINNNDATFVNYASNPGINNFIEDNYTSSPVLRNDKINYTNITSAIAWTGRAGYRDQNSMRYVINTQTPTGTIAGSAFDPLTFNYSVGWQIYTPTAGFGTKYLYNTGANWTMEYTFKGTNTEIKGSKYVGSGDIKITISNLATDEIEKTFTVNMNKANTTLTPEVMIKVSGLPLTKHKVKIEPANANTNTVLYFMESSSFPAAEYNFKGDKIDYYGTKLSNAGKVKILLDGNENTAFIGNLNTSDPWNGIKSFTGLAAGNHRLTIEGIVDGDKITLDKLDVRPLITGTFNGTDAALLISKDPHSCIADLYIDGVLYSSPDLYAASQTFGVIPVSGLTAGNHKFELVGKSERNAASDGNVLGFDGIQSAKASFEFNGTGIEYAATKGPDKGKTEIFIDGISQGVFDLYAASNQQQQIVFSKTGLSDTVTHKIDVIPLGQKNTSSSSAAVNIDYFNVTTPVVAGSIFNLGTANGEYGYGVDADQPPAYRVQEELGSVIIDVYRTGSTVGTASVDVSLTSFTATASVDYDDSNFTTTVNFADGESVKTVTIPIINDEDYESDEDFTVSLTNPSSGSQLGTNYTGTVTIVNSDTAIYVAPYPCNDEYRNIVVDSDGDFYVSETGSSEIRRIDKTTGAVTVISNSSSIYFPRGITFDSNDNMYVIDDFNNTIKKIANVESGSPVVTIVVSSGLVKPVDLKFDSNNNLYVSDGGDFKVKKITGVTVGSPSVTTIAGNGTSYDSASYRDINPLQFGFTPSEIDVDSQGNVYFINLGGPNIPPNGTYMNKRVEKISNPGTGGATLNHVFGSGLSNSYNNNADSVSDPLLYDSGSTVTSIAIDSSDNLYVANQYRIKKIIAPGTTLAVMSNFAGGPLKEIPKYNSNDIMPHTMVFASGNIYFTTLYGLVGSVNTLGAFSYSTVNGFTGCDPYYGPGGGS